MLVTFNLVITKTGSVRIYKTSYSPSPSEIVVKVNLEVPDEIFNRPKLLANMSISKEAVPPETVSAETLVKCEKAIKFATGLDMHVSVVKEDEENAEGENSHQD